jgi:hypothetical protein
LKLRTHLTSSHQITDKQENKSRLVQANTLKPDHFASSQRNNEP